MLKYRLLTSVIGVPFVICIVYLGGWIFFLTVLGIILIAAYEFFKFAKNEKINYSIYFSLFLNAIIVLFTFTNKNIYILPLFMLSIIVSSIYKALFQDEIDKLLEKVSLEVFSALYIALPLSYFLLIRNLPKGEKFIILLLGIVWLNDSFAYFIGKKMGKTKINTHISPNKTMEGAIGGFFGGLVSGLIFAYFFKFNLISVFFLSIIIVAISQLGDLVESAFKREVGIKDAGNIIPGHGGILDRFDGLIFATPVYYYLIILVFNKLGG